MFKGRVLKCAQFFYERDCLVGIVGSSRVGDLCCLRGLGRPGTLIRHSLSQCPHPFFAHHVLGDFIGLGLTHADMVRRRYFLSYEGCEF